MAALVRNVLDEAGNQGGHSTLGALEQPRGGAAHVVAAGNGGNPTVLQVLPEPEEPHAGLVAQAAQAAHAALVAQRDVAVDDGHEVQAEGLDAQAGGRPDQDHGAELHEGAQAAQAAPAAQAQEHGPTTCAGSPRAEAPAGEVLGPEPKA